MNTDEIMYQIEGALDDDSRAYWLWIPREFRAQYADDVRRGATTLERILQAVERWSADDMAEAI